MQPTPDKMDVISAEAQTGCWGTAVPRRTELENGARWRQRANEMQIWGISEEQEPQIEEENVEESK